MQKASATERFDAKVARGASESACWIWTAARTGNGYGSFSVRPRVHALAHRYSYERHVGPIPDGHQLDHLCRNRACVNPRHLEPVEPKVNYLRGVGIPAINARLTACRRGHPFDAQNTRVERSGARRCRKCRDANRKARGW